MNIIIYSLAYAPEMTGVGKYTGNFAESLARRGHSVRVITGYPFYPGWKIFSSYFPYWYKTEIRNQVKVHRCPVWVPARPTGWGRILMLASFCISSLPVALYTLTRKPHIVFALEPHLLYAPQAFCLARCTRARAWLHIQDLEVDAGIRLQQLRGRYLASLALRFEMALLRKFDYVSTISHAMASRLRNKYSRDIYYMPNAVDLDTVFPDRDAGAALRRRLGYTEDVRIVLYSGNLGLKQGLEIIPEIAQQCVSNPKIIFLVCGEGIMWEPLQQAARTLPNLHVRPLFPEQDLNALYNMADLHLIPQRPEAADLVLPSKLLHILSAGGAVLVTANLSMELSQITYAAGGWVAPPGDAAALAASILARLADPDALHQARVSARRYAEIHFDQKRILDALEQALVLA